MDRICTQCRLSFEITDSDLSFLDLLSPIFGGKKEEISIPARCPDCRLRRRLCERNNRNLYYRKCDLTGKQIISQYSSQVPFPVYGIDVWSSDQWDGVTYGRDIDFSRPFFEQFKELLQVVPHLSLFNTPGTMENSDYNNCTGYLKNCYLICESDFNEDCYYSNLLKKGKDIINLGVREFYIKMSVNGELREAFSGRTLDAPKEGQDYTKEIIAASRKKYCTPKKAVEEMLLKWDEAASAPPSKAEQVDEEKFEEPLI